MDYTERNLLIALGAIMAVGLIVFAFVFISSPIVQVDEKGQVVAIITRDKVSHSPDKYDQLVGWFYTEERAQPSWDRDRKEGR